MKTRLRILALALALGGLVVWLAAGANRGWTKTSVRTMTLDEVTGIESPSYEKRFVPGLDMLGGVWLVAAGLAGVSLLVRNRTPTHL